MNKGMIMEVNRNYAITLNDQGLMEKITFKQDMEVGQKIFYFEDDIVKTSSNKVHRYNNFIKAFGSIAALFLLVFFTFFNTTKYNQAYAVVSLDINPSIQIEADSSQNIIKVEGVNLDGKNIDFSDIKDIPLDDGIDKIKEKLIAKNYLDTNKEVLVGYAFIKNGDNNDYVDTLKYAIQSTFKTEKITYVKGDKEAVDEAKTKGISLGRYEASLKVDEETKNKIDKAPVKDITSSIKDKANVDQWQAEDEKVVDEKENIDNVPEVNTNPQIKNEEPGKVKPEINVPIEKPVFNTDEEKEKEKGKDNNTKPQDNGVLELNPEVPQITDESTLNPSKDNNIVIAPDDGTIQNNTTSAKTEEDPNKIPEESTKNKEPLVNKDIKSKAF